MLTQCECGVVVDNALDSVKAKADLVMVADHGAGVEELIRELLWDDLSHRLSSTVRRGLVLGTARTNPSAPYICPALANQFSSPDLRVAGNPRPSPDFWSEWRKAPISSASWIPKEITRPSSRRST
jgi:hypothetical protein